MACKYLCGFRYQIDSIWSYNVWFKVYRRKPVNRTVIFTIHITVIASKKYHSGLQIHQNSPGGLVHTPICTTIWIVVKFDFVAFWSKLFTLLDTYVFSTSTSIPLRLTSKAVSVLPSTYLGAFNLILTHLGGFGRISGAVQSCEVVWLRLPTNAIFCRCQLLIE